MRFVMCWMTVLTSAPVGVRAVSFPAMIASLAKSGDESESQNPFKIR
jgi:hypothetical protein